jgi:surfactin synthase thioesterase subunit
VSSARAPQLPEPLPDYLALNDAELLAELTALGTLPPALVSHAELAAASLPTMRADLELAASYQFSVTQESLDVAIDAISGADDPSVPAASVRAWAELTSAAFSMTLIPGGHALSFQSARLVTEVTAACERALRGEGGAQNP